MMLKKTVTAVVLAAALAFGATGCGDSAEQSVFTDRNVVPAPAVQNVPVQILTTLQAREIPNLVTTYRISAFNDSGFQLFGPEDLAKAADITVEIPSTSTFLTIQFLDAGGNEIGSFQKALSLVAGEVFVISDPDFDYTTGYSNITFDFEDISTTGTKLDTISNSDDDSESISFGFDFNLLGDTFSSIDVVSNGFLTTSSSGTTIDYAIDFPPFSGFDSFSMEPDPTNMIAPYFTDLLPSQNYVDSADTGQGIFWEVKGAAGGRRLIVQFQNITLIDDDVPFDPLTFQVKLYEGSNIVEFHYKDVDSDGDSTNERGFGNYSGDGPTWIGLANIGATDVRQFSLNQLGAVESNTAIRFIP